jgi:Cu2+-exporting ATPase
MRVTHAGDESTLGQLRALIERGLASRPPVADIADRLAPVLVAIVLVAAVATFCSWLVVDASRAWPAAIAVLIITCPCALALATPLTLALAAARFARSGIAPLRMSALDALATAPTAVLDKTGTLTRGRVALVDTNTFGIDPEPALVIAAALEAASVHPIAAALCALALGPVPVVVAASSAGGAGVTGCVNGRRWWIGAPEFAADARGAVAQSVRSMRDRGALVAVLTDRASRAAVFAFDDPARDGLAHVGPALRRLGVSQSVCLSGDRSAAVVRQAMAAGLDDAVAGCGPAEKLAWVLRAQGRGMRVLVVGDGLNDAATLAAADASISFSAAPAAAQSAADFLVLGVSLDAIPLARTIARHARAILRQNLAWALAYNALAIPLAAAGLVSPLLAALGMAASSALVVANAMRLATDDAVAAKSWRPPFSPPTNDTERC